MASKRRRKPPSPKSASQSEEPQATSRAVERSRSIQEGDGDRNHHLRARASLPDAIVEAEFYSGTIPHPEIIAKWQILVPTAGERILAMAEQQTAHRQALEALALPAALNAQRRGQQYGLTTAIVGLGAATVAVIMHEPVAASVLGGGTLAIMVTAFITGRAAQAKERREQRERVD